VGVGSGERDSKFDQRGDKAKIYSELEWEVWALWEAECSCDLELELRRQKVHCASHGQSFDAKTDISTVGSP
jgi:hypothetical protein